MKQLSGSDNIFLVQENSNIYTHVGMLLIYDVSTAPGGKVRFKDILKHFEDRMYQHPVFRRRLVNVPLGMDRPYWVDEAEIDMEFHVRHIALPKPGDWRQLMIQVARLHSRPLDRTRPLWEAYVIEGLDNIPKLPTGSFAMFMKLHHSAVDGMAGIHLANQLHASTPSTEAPQGKRTSLYVDRDLAPAEYITRALTNGVGRVVQAGKVSTRLAGKILEIGAEQISVYRQGTLQPKSKSDGGPPKTRFGGKVSPNRVVNGFGMPLSRIKRVRTQVPGATLNDIFLAVAGGAVRTYLAAKNELPKKSLVALMPMTLRSDGAEGGNSVGGAAVKVRSDVADPLERLKLAHSEAQAGKEQAEKLGPDLLATLIDTLPSRVGNLLVSKVLIPTMNMTVSNVRGPDQALFLAGAKAMCLYPVNVPTDGLGLSMTGVSYNGVMWVSVTSCRSMVPDPEFFTQCMKSAWEEILAAADALPVAAGNKAVTRPIAAAAAPAKSSTASKTQTTPKKATTGTKVRSK